MKKQLITLSLLGFVAVGCSNSDKYNISDSTVGPLTKTTKVSELKTVFVNDSLVDASGDVDFSTPQGYVTVYEKGGEKLLELGPSSEESNATVNYIRVFDERYTTTGGVTTKSTFKDIREGYTIKRIDNLISTIVVLIEDSDIYFTIDKKHLPSELMFDTKAKIELSQIPDEAPIKYVQISW